MRVSFSGQREGELCAHVHVPADVELSRILPLLESVGVVVAAHTAAADGAEIAHRFTVRPVAGELDPAGDGPRLAAAIEACWRGWCDVDSLNRLVGSAGLDWRAVAVLRAYRHYHRYLHTGLSGATIDDALCANPAVAALLAAYFRARFTGGSDGAPAGDPETVDSLAARIEAACDATVRLDHDEALRRMLDLLRATVATNAVPGDAGADGAAAPKPLALKLDSSLVPALPLPVPYREIFVFSPDMEGVHLRGGPVARGGIRWSERMDDLRDEILALMKAQVLKNALIVPTGAKGGFLLRRRAEDPSLLREQVREAYLAFIGALLDVTGPDDPYLVVAADKGTATFSDVANDLAVERGLWLEDAFASGGSLGYDHKALGITARGAWAAATQHLREVGMRAGVDPISVVGIGDMSGDVFGNGMVLVDGLRLVAAFDHRDIFLDPDPDPVRALAERRRLQALPRSSWQDYDREAISEGGGVFSRALKRIELTPQVRQVLRVEAEALTPAELIRAILSAPVDLLFAGGIGTYVRARTERDSDIGDRANDTVRIPADDLRARVYAEGANLSITQAARIQYARRGGRVNQDAVDNAAGVAISDREVNAKILLAGAGVDAEERAKLLAACVDDVVAGVLEDVTLQAVCLTVEQRAASGREPAYERLMGTLAAAGTLDREAELLPSTAEMATREELGAGLVRPELATLMAHAKRTLTAAVTDSGLAGQSALAGELRRYFPAAMADRAGPAVERHPLRRELIATRLANDVVNRLGIRFPFELAHQTGASLAAVAAAYWVVRELLDADAVWGRLLALQDELGTDRYLELNGRVHGLVAALMRALLADDVRRVAVIADPSAVVVADGDAFTALRQALPGMGPSRRRRQREDEMAQLEAELGDRDVAALLAVADELALAPEILGLWRGRSRDVAEVGEAFLILGDQLGAPRVARLLERAEISGEWAERQRDGLAEDWAATWRTAVRLALGQAPQSGVHDALRAFLGERSVALPAALDIIAEAEREDHAGLEAVAVIVRAVSRAVGGGAAPGS